MAKCHLDLRVSFLNYMDVFFAHVEFLAPDRCEFRSRRILRESGMVRVVSIRFHLFPSKRQRNGEGRCEDRHLLAFNRCSTTTIPTKLETKTRALLLSCTSPSLPHHLTHPLHPPTPFTHPFTHSANSINRRSTLFPSCKSSISERFLASHRVDYLYWGSHLAWLPNINSF